MPVRWKVSPSSAPCSIDKVSFRKKNKVPSEQAAQGLESGAPRVSDQLVCRVRASVSSRRVTQGVSGLCPLLGVSSTLCAPRARPLPLRPGTSSSSSSTDRQGARRPLGERAGSSHTVVEKSFILSAGPHVVWPGRGPGIAERSPSPLPLPPTPASLCPAPVPPLAPGFALAPSPAGRHSR